MLQNMAALNEAVTANINTGVLMLCKEALVTAIQDRRLERGHLRVLAAMVGFINSRSAKAWPSRQIIAEELGVSLKTVSNTLLELRNFGYVIAAKEAVQEANNRRLTVYTLGNIDHDTIRKEITSWVHSVRDARATATPEKVPAPGELESPRPRGTSPPTGSSEQAKVPAHGVGKSPPTGDSNSKKELNREEGEKRPLVGQYNFPPQKQAMGAARNPEIAFAERNIRWSPSGKLSIEGELRAELSETYSAEQIEAGLEAVPGAMGRSRDPIATVGQIRRQCMYQKRDTKGAKPRAPVRASRWSLS